MHDPISINQMSLVNAINEELSRQCPGLPFCPSIFNTVINAANLVVEECARKPVKATSGMTIAQWFNCDDTGESSKYMASVLDAGSTRLPIQTYAFPYDIDDFGRCLRMVEATGSEDKVYLMLGTGKEWRFIATIWERMAALYKAGKYPELYELLQEARK